MKQVTAAVIERRGKVLIALRSPEGDQGGKWEFPGGTIENGEIPAQCLARELEEELGLQCRVGELIAKGPGGRPGSPFELLVFRVDEFQGSAKALAHEEVRWVRPRDLARHELAEADARLLPVILAALEGGEEAGPEKKK